MPDGTDGKIRLGTKTAPPSKIFLGTKPVKKVYLGPDEVWKSSQPGLYFIDNNNNIARFYNTDRQADTSKNISLGSGNWTDANQFGDYIGFLNATDRKIYMYDLNGDRVSAEDHTLPAITDGADNKFYEGIFSNSSRYAVIKNYRQNMIFRTQYTAYNTDWSITSPIENIVRSESQYHNRFYGGFFTETRIGLLNQYVNPGPYGKYYLRFYNHQRQPQNAETILLYTGSQNNHHSFKGCFASPDRIIAIRDDGQTYFYNHSRTRLSSEDIVLLSGTYTGGCYVA